MFGHLSVDMRVTHVPVCIKLTNTLISWLASGHHRCCPSPFSSGTLGPYWIKCVTELLRIYQLASIINQYLYHKLNASSTSFIKIRPSIGVHRCLNSLMVLSLTKNLPSSFDAYDNVSEPGLSTLYCLSHLDDHVSL